MAITKNIFIDQGATFVLSLTASSVTGAPINISSGYTASAQLRRSYYSSTAYSFETSITGSTGGFQISLSATASAALTPGRYVYDVELLNNANGVVTRIVQGNASIDPEVTKV